MNKTLKKYILIGLGIISIGLGSLGIFLPLLPTTPFLLLAAACFLRSSKRLHTWVMQHKWFGSYIRNYCEHRAIPKKTKITTITLLWVTIGYSAFFIVSLITVKLLLLCIAIGVTWHLLSLKTLEEMNTPSKVSEKLFSPEENRECSC